MGNFATELPSLQSNRVRALVWPREHGAWGILLVPLATGAAVGLTRGGHVVGVVIFALAALALFCLRVPVEVALGTTPWRIQTGAEREAVANFIGLYAAIAALTLGLLFWRGYERGLLAIGATSALAFGAQALLRKLGRATRMLSQIVGALGLTSTAAGAYYVATGRFDATALVLWGANWLFVANQVQFVQLRIHAARADHVGEKLGQGWTFLAAEAASVVLLITAWRVGWLSPWAMLAFVPALARGTAWFLAGRQPLAVRRLGWSELSYGITFGALLTAALLAT